MNKTMSAVVVPFTIVAAVAASGCAENPKRVENPQGGLTTTTTTSPRASERRPVSPTIAVSSDIARACNLTFSNVERAPKFAFDDTDLSASDRDVLQKIAQCVTTGPLRGKRLALVGRADPRGTTEYNMALGARRASTVATYLGGLGVSGSSVRETSRGELDATGRDESSWQVDRRVDISLAL